MRIYAHEPKDLVRLMITRKGDKTEYVTVIDASQDQVIQRLKEILSTQKVGVFEKYLTQIAVREAKGGKNGKSKSLSIMGLSPIQVVELIVSHIK